jgi:alkanesulfonate monooxygenase SsuD/methylene tetrahydromethanopterin reductase-like flavin-dependent oxidoreductase (luciferase family)
MHLLPFKNVHYNAHLITFRGQAFSLLRLVDYAEAAEQLGFTTLCTNDHLTFSRPWLDVSLRWPSSSPRRVT